MKIFVVDDDLISRMALIDAINSVGGDVFDLVEYQSGDDAWRALQGKGVPPMLICCDIRMPGISGLELLEKVRAKSETKDLPFVLISSANDAETIKKAVASGVSGFIVKPFAHDDAKTRMSKALNLARHKSIESPAETMTRLKLSLERYKAYLSGLSGQVHHLMGELHNLNDGELKKIKDKCEPIRLGCTTLGMWRAAALLAFVKSEASSYEDMVDSLGEIMQQVHYQNTSL